VGKNRQDGKQRERDGQDFRLHNFSPSRVFVCFDPEFGIVAAAMRVIGFP
jgi:hypothetical protein